MHVYSYWKCDSCGSIIRGDSRECPNCGSPIPNNVKYMMPDNPTIIAAMKDGTILTGDKKINVDEKGIRSEIVEEKDERDNPNWKCHFCGFQNFDESNTCAGCGADRTTDTYFGDKIASMSKRSETHTTQDVEDKIDTYEPPKFEHKKISTSKTEENTTEKIIEAPTTTEKPNKLDVVSNFIRSAKDFIYENSNAVLIVLGLMILIPFLIWLFTPVQREARITSFSWERSIDVEEYRLCHEDDWSVPPGGVVTDERQEIHHYDHVLDHYETKTRQCSREVFDGYDTEYRDLGNGQAEVVQVPRYRTEYYTEEYEEPVYRDEPVYRTKYYYDIGRWKYDYALTTSGNDQNAYWHETDLPTDVYNPNYGDLRQGSRHESYIVHLVNANDEQYTITYNYNDWMNLQVGDVLRYKSFRFSDQPLSEVEVVRKKQASSD